MDKIDDGHAHDDNAALSMLTILAPVSMLPLQPRLTGTPPHEELGKVQV